MRALDELSVRRSRRARRIILRVTPDGRPELVLPPGTSLDEGMAFARSRADWLASTCQALRQRAGPVVAPRWDSRDRLPLHGSERLLRHLPARLPAPQLRVGDAVELLAPAAWATEPARLSAALRGALREYARAHAERLIGQALQGFPRKPTGLRIADQRTRWGSCSGRGVISLNWRLVMAPDPVFAYVVVHELCHLLHPDHSPRFWAEVARHCPHHAEARAWLREHGTRLGAVLPRPRA